MTEELDCLKCGACCHTGFDGRILIPAEDLVRWKQMGRDDLIEQTVEGHFGERAFAYKGNGACVHLNVVQSAEPSVGTQYICQIYEIRGTTCRTFEKGSWQCREFRRDAQLD